MEAICYVVIVSTWEELVPETGSTLRTNAGFLAAQVDIMNNRELTELQQGLGLTYHKHALLLDHELDDIFDHARLASMTTCMDYMSMEL